MTENRLDQPIGNNFRYGGIRQNCTLREWLNLDNRTIGYRPRQLVLSAIQSLEAENANLRHDLERVMKRENRYLNDLVWIEKNYRGSGAGNRARASLNTEGEDGI